MSDKSAIEWTDATWNPIVGCSLVSPGCTNCYAMKMAARIENIDAKKRLRSFADHRHLDDAHPQGRDPARTKMLDAKTHYAGTTLPDKAVWSGNVALAPDHIITQPLHWKKPRKIFVNSMGDLFHESVPDEWIDRAFAVMALAPQHTFQILTKRPKRAREYLTAPRRPHKVVRACVDLLAEKKLTTKTLIDDWPVESIGDIDLPDDITLRAWPLPNVWLGATAENQQCADERRDDLEALGAQGWTTFVSYEPALGPIDWTRWGFVDQIIFGGETGPGARPPHPDWARATRDFCRPRAIAYFHKQWGEWSVFYDRDVDDPDWRRPPTVDGQMGRGATRFHNLAGGMGFHGERVIAVRNVGKTRAGRLLDGREHNEFPRPA